MKFITTICLLIFGFSFSSFAQTDTLQQYTGKYKFPEGSVVAEVEVTYADGTLTMNSSAGSTVLRHDKDDIFTLVSFEGTAIFTRNAQRKIIGVHIEAMGYTLDGTKEDARDGSSASWQFYAHKYTPATGYTLTRLHR
jgi:alanine racemase